MRYYLLLFLLAISGFAAFLFMSRDKRIEIIKNSHFAENSQLTIGALFDKNFAKHEWQSITGDSGKPKLLFTAIILPQDSLRLQGAQINFEFSVNTQASEFTTDTVWWSYPPAYLEKKRSELNCFEDAKLRKSLQLLYAKPGNLMVQNDNRWHLLTQPALKVLFSEQNLHKISSELLANAPLSSSANQGWQISFDADWSSLNWPAGAKMITFVPNVQQEIIKTLQHNTSLNQQLAYLSERHSLNQQDSSKIFF